MCIRDRNHSLQAGQRSAEHRIIVRVDPARLDQPSPTPPDLPFRWEPRRKFQDRVWWHALLLVLTIGTTTYLGVERYLAFVLDFAPLRALPMPFPQLLLRGFWYSGTSLAILGCHELGHY